MKVSKVEIPWTAGATGTVAPILVPMANIAWLGETVALYGAKTVPGDPAPQDNYTVKVEDADGIDLLGGAGATRDDAVAELALARVGVEAFVPVLTDLRVVIDDNNVAGAKGTVILIFVG